jgi:hypothetical protein
MDKKYEFGIVLGKNWVEIPPKNLNSKNYNLNLSLPSKANAFTGSELFAK